MINNIEEPSEQMIKMQNMGIPEAQARKILEEIVNPIITPQHKTQKDPEAQKSAIGLTSRAIDFSA
jgi:hypothetical protein